MVEIWRKLTGSFHLEFSAMTVYALRIGGAFLTFLLQVILARWLGQYEYGLFALVWSCVIILGELLSFGFYNLIQRLIPEYKVKGDMPLLRGALWGAGGMIALASIVVALLFIGILVALNASGSLPSNYMWALIIGSTSLPAFALADFLSGIGRSNGWMVRAFAPTALFRPVAIISLLAGALALGAGASATTAMASATLAVWFTLLISLVSIGASLPDEMKNGPRHYKLQPWLFAALPMMMVSSFELVLFNLDVLMISYFLPPDRTGIYFAATKIMALVAFLNFAVGSAFTASFAEAHAANEPEKLKRAVRYSTTLIFYPSLIMIGFILLLRGEILSLFGPGFTEASIIILPLAIGMCCRAFIGAGERILMMAGEQKLCAGIYISAVIADIILNLCLIPLYGIIGAAIATSLVFVLMAIMQFTAIRRRLNITTIPLPISEVLGLIKALPTRLRDKSETPKQN